MPTIDLNADLGESYGAYTLGQDAALMPFLTSANIACGLHAGDPLVMEASVRLAKAQWVQIGAHPGYPDLQGFGRRAMGLAPEEAEAYVLYQVGALAAFCRAHGVELTHLKPHGALYNQAARDRGLAAAIVRAARRFSLSLVVVGLAGSVLVEEALQAGQPVAGEGFPERAYNPDGSLRSRTLPGALIEDPAEAAAQAVRLALEGVQVGEQAAVVQTLCIHGDSPNATAVAEAVRNALVQAGVHIQPLLAAAL